MKICSELCGVHDGTTTLISFSLDLSRKKKENTKSLYKEMHLGNSRCIETFSATSNFLNVCHDIKIMKGAS